MKIYKFVENLLKESITINQLKNLLPKGVGISDSDSGFWRKPTEKFTIKGESHPCFIMVDSDGEELNVTFTDRNDRQALEFARFIELKPDVNAIAKWLSSPDRDKSKLPTK